MLTPYVRKLVFTYLKNAVRRLGRRQPLAAGIAEWLSDNADMVGIEPIAHYLGDRDTPPPEAAWRRLRNAIDEERRATKGTKPDRAARRLAELGDMIDLTDDDIAVLEVLLRYQTNPIIEDLIDTMFEGRRRHGWGQSLNLKRPSLATLLGTTANSLRQRLAPSAPLIRAGLVQIDEDQDISCANRLNRLASVVDDAADVRELLLGASRESDLEWSDFDHLGQSRDDVERLLRGALEREAKGVNILVYGPPGTGKTEFCRVLAKRIGVNLFSVGEADEGGDEPSRRDRLTELRLAQSLLGEDRKAVLLFDEMEDLLWDGGFEMPFAGLFGRRRQGGASKVFMNRLLEETPAPTLWTTNVADGINPAILRRMMFALEMRQPPPRIRSRIWSRQLARHGIDATENDASALAHEFDATPGVAAGATSAADLAGGDFDTVRRGIRSLSRVLGCERANAKPATPFDPTLIEADLDVESLLKQLAGSDQRRFSLCLQGPPGSGKSAFVRHLAERLSFEVMHKRTSDLIDKWVGSTERNIAAAFAEARDERAFLVFDEADSLLADRRGAQRSWEVSQVNEMLTWMESHPMPFACTTNLGETLDSAALRRFLFKVTLGYLRPPAAASAFRAFFNLEPPLALGALTNLTPGDFELVQRKATMLGQLKDADTLTTMLTAECKAKPGNQAAVGFG